MPRRPSVIMEPEHDESKFIKSYYEIDHGKDGITKITVWDPCITQEQQEKRRQALLATFYDLVRRGEIGGMETVK